MKNYTVFYWMRGEHVSMPFGLAKNAHAYVKWLRRVKAQSISVVRDDNMCLHKKAQRDRRAARLIRQVSKLPFDEAIVFVRRELNADYQIVFTDAVADWCARHQKEISQLNSGE